LIMVTLPTVASLFSTCGCFLWDERSSSRDLPPISLYLVDSLSVRMALSLTNGGASRDLGLMILRVQGKGGRTDPWSGPGWPASADRPRPFPSRFGRNFAPVGPHAVVRFAPTTCTNLMTSSSSPRWRFSVHEVRSFTLQSSRMFLCITSVLATIGAISSSSWTWTRLRNCTLELVVNPSFMSMFSYINRTLPNVCTKMNLLYD
jgi:hypothetical protein